jgi:integrase
MKCWIEGKKRVGPWKIRWREIVNGKAVKRSSRTFTSLSDAKAEAEAMDSHLERLTASLPKRGEALLSIPVILSRWSAAGITAERMTKAYAYQAEQVITALCAANGWTSTNHITAESVEAWRATKPRGHTRPVAVLKSLLRWARGTLRQPVDQALLDLPMRQGKHRPPPPLLSDAQVAAIIARAYAFGPSVGAIIEHLSLFGNRPIDLVRLNVSNWNQAERTLTHAATKNRSKPSHPINGPFIAHAKRLDDLCRNRPPDEPLFVSPTGQRWRINDVGSSRQLVDYYYANITDKLPQIQVEQRGIYCLKDYAITKMERAGIDDRTKALFTGHTSLSVFQRYKTTNADNASEALRKLGGNSSNQGANLGANKISGAKSAGNRDDTTKQNTRKSPQKPANMNKAKSA